jgi:hypothetical protein
VIASVPPGGPTASAIGEIVLKGTSASQQRCQALIQASIINAEVRFVTYLDAPSSASHSTLRT